MNAHDNILRVAVTCRPVRDIIAVLQMSRLPERIPL